MIIDAIVSVQVMVCCVSSEIYDVKVKELKQDGYKHLKQPFVAYAFNREVFSLKLKGNFQALYMVTSNCNTEAVFLLFFLFNGV